MSEMSALEKVDGAAKLLVYLLCIDTNATKATYTIEGFHDRKSGIVYGDYEIVVRKTEPKKESI